MRAVVRKKLTVAGAALTAVAIPTLFALIGGPASASPGQTVTSLNSTTKETLATTLANGHGSVSDVAFVGQPEQGALFSGFGPALGIPSGVVLSTGYTSLAEAAAGSDEGSGTETVSPEPTDTGVIPEPSTSTTTASTSPSTTITTTITAMAAPRPGGGRADADAIEGPPGASDSYSSGEFGGDGDADLDAAQDPAFEPTEDAAVLEFDFTPTVSQFTIVYVYGSQEYEGEGEGEMSTSIESQVVEAPGYPDPMAVFYDGNLCTPFADSALVSTESINGVTNADWFVDNTEGAYDTDLPGFSVPLSCTLTGTPGTPVHIKLVIADSDDDSVDSYALFAPFNAPPAVLDYAVEGTGDPVVFPLPATDSDGDAITYTLATLPTHGTAAVSGASIIYTPNAGYVGVDSFTYTGADQFGTSNVGTITVTTIGLAATGASPAPHMALGLSLVLAGAGAVALGRRRREV